MRISANFAKVSAVACAVLLASAPTAVDAGWGSSGGSWGGASYGSYGGASYGGYSVGYGSYGSYGSHGTGPVRRLLSHIGNKIHNLGARRAYYGSYGSHGSYGSYVANYGSCGGYHVANYGSSGGSYYSGSYSGGSSGAVSGSYGSVGSGVVETSYGSVGTSYGTSYGSAGSTYYGTANETSYDSVGSLVSAPTEIDDSVMLTVAVPASAKVFVNDNSTTSVGSVRQFVSRGLVAGKSYQFKVRAELEDANGKIVSDVKTVTMVAGQREAIEFSLANEKTPIETAVTLHVPEGSKVVLAGSETNAVGATRTFRTKLLSAGQVWDDYTIQVKLGDEVKEQKVRLFGGDQIELSFDFGATPDRLAAR